MTPALAKLIAKGESATLELKRSTGELRATMPTLCAFANGRGGLVVIGVKPSGELVGQQVSEQTLHDVAATSERVEPPIIEEPSFTEGSGAVTVTFRAEVVAGAHGLVPSGHQVGKSALSRYEVQVLELADVPRPLAKLMVPSGRTDRTKFRDQVVASLLEAGLLEMTIPGKPRSSKQQYRITEVGSAALVSARRR